MKTMSEMAIETGINDKNNYSGQLDWEFYKKPENKKHISKFVDKIGSKNYTIYKTGKNIISYFLVQGDIYKGVLQIEEFPKGTARILTSNSKIRGFYQLMFMILLTKFDKILSDVSLSSPAIKSYEKLSKMNIFNISVVEYSSGKERTVPFSKKMLLKNPGNKVQIEEKQKGFMREHLKEYNRRIEQEENGRPSTFKRMFMENDENLDLFLFGNYIN